MNEELAIRTVVSLACGGAAAWSIGVLIWKVGHDKVEEALAHGPIWSAVIVGTSVFFFFEFVMIAFGILGLVFAFFVLGPVVAKWVQGGKKEYVELGLMNPQTVAGLLENKVSRDEEDVLRQLEELENEDLDEDAKKEQREWLYEKLRGGASPNGNGELIRTGSGEAHGGYRRYGSGEE